MITETLVGDDARRDANGESVETTEEVSDGQDEKKELYSADRPITLDKQDLFGRAPFANRSV